MKILRRVKLLSFERKEIEKKSRRYLPAATTPSEDRGRKKSLMSQVTKSTKNTIDENVLLLSSISTTIRY